MTLNDKQRRFVEEYLVDLNATQAAIRAGYSAKTAKQQGNRLLTHVDVQRAVNEAQAERSERTGITADYVLETIRATIEQCRQLEPVVRSEGEIVVPWNPAAVLKGAELLGKHLKLFTDKVEHTGKDGGPIQTEQVEADADAFRRRLLSGATAGSAGSGTQETQH